MKLLIKRGEAVRDKGHAREAEYVATGRGGFQYN